MTVLISTHAMDEANYLCDRLAIMDRGRILCEDAPEALKRSLPTGEHVEIETDREIEARDKDGAEAAMAHHVAASETGVRAVLTAIRRRLAS